MKRFMAAILSVAMWASVLAAQSRTSDVDSRHAPLEAEPTPGGMDPLVMLVGEWDVTYLFDAGVLGSGGMGTGRMVCRLSPDGRSIILDYAALSGPAFGLKLHEIHTWDSILGAYSLLRIESTTPWMMNETGRIVGEDIVYTGEIYRNEQRILTKDVISDRSPTSFTLTTYAAIDGSPLVRASSISYTRPK